MENGPDEECGNLPITACLVLSPPFYALFISFICLFPEAAIFIHSQFLCGWRLARAHVSYVLVCECVCLLGAGCICLCTRQHSVYFQSILFKDQTRAWWLIFLSTAFFHLLRKKKEGREEKRRGLSSTKARNNLHKCTTDHPPPPYLGGLTTPPRSAPKEGLFSLG